MPSHEEHCQDSSTKYGKRFDDLHRWMDSPWQVLGKKHRMYRHDPYTTPKEAKKLFGEYADHACLDHILLDWRHSQKRFNPLSNLYIKQGSSVKTRNSRTSAQPTSQPIGKTDQCYTNQVSKKTSLHKDLLDVFKELAKISSELDRLPQGKAESLQKTSKDSWGTKAQDLFNMIILLKMVKCFLPG